MSIVRARDDSCNNAAAERRDALFPAEPLQHDPNLLFGREPPAGVPPNLPNHLLRRSCPRHGVPPPLAGKCLLLHDPYVVHIRLTPHTAVIVGTLLAVWALVVWLFPSLFGPVPY